MPATIVAVALQLVDEVGLQAFPLRTLADALGSGTATLYRHFAGKDELMTYVICFAAQQHGPGSADPDSGPKLRKYYQRLDPAAYPAIAAADELISVPLDEEFRFGLDLIMEGLDRVRGRTV
ncbi:helix-turn-helix domain-containing protein [Streptosporangium sp. NPDC006007]|uniref:TetR/AcrR family transcriptional regulator n=1 Tax=Streptosporangium sp. NPDC006007 TaxID=3154575 RepID=UPI0033A1EE60